MPLLPLASFHQREEKQNVPSLTTTITHPNTQTRNCGNTHTETYCKKDFPNILQGENLLLQRNI